MSGYDKSGWHFTRNWQKQLVKCKNILSKSVVLCDISYIWIDNVCLGWLIIENCVIISKNILFLCAFWRTGLVVLCFVVAMRTLHQICQYRALRVWTCFDLVLIFHFVSFLFTINAGYKIHNYTIGNHQLLSISGSFTHDEHQKRENIPTIKSYGKQFILLTVLYVPLFLSFVSLHFYVWLALIK